MYQAISDFLARATIKISQTMLILDIKGAQKPDKPAFIWFAEKPKNAGYFSDCMLEQRKGIVTRLDV